MGAGELEGKGAADAGGSAGDEDSLSGEAGGDLGEKGRHGAGLVRTEEVDCGAGEVEEGAREAEGHGVEKGGRGDGGSLVGMTCVDSAGLSLIHI